MSDDLSKSDIRQLIDEHDDDEPFPEDLRIMADAADVDVSGDLPHTTPGSDVGADTVSLTIDLLESGSQKTCDVDVTSDVACHILKVEAGGPVTLDTIQTLRQALGLGVSSGFIAYHSMEDSR